MTARRAFALLKKIVEAWIDDRAPRMGAVLGPRLALRRRRLTST